MNVADIDCGTNSVHLLIAEAAPDGSLRNLVREMGVVRLGQRIDRAGKFAQEALERTLAVAEEYGEACRTHGVTSIRFAVTSAAHDVRNRLAFVEGVRSRLEVSPQILSGEEEARVGFTNAILGMPPGTKSLLLAVGLGGGSTEIVLGTMTGELLRAYSMDVGCVRIHKGHLGADVPGPQAVEAARRDVNPALDATEGHINLGAAKGLTGLAGSVATITAKALGLRSYDPERIHETVLSVDGTFATCGWFLSSAGTEREALGFVHPGKVDVIPTGALIWSEVVAGAAARIRETRDELAGITTSEHDILDNLVMWAARSPQPPSWRGSESSPGRG